MPNGSLSTCLFVFFFSVFADVSNTDTVPSENVVLSGLYYTELNYPLGIPSVCLMFCSYTKKITLYSSCGIVVTNPYNLTASPGGCKWSVAGDTQQHHV